jgi:hypothetical protein
MCDEGREFASQMEVLRAGVVVPRLREGRRDMETRRVNHVCSQDVCDPQREWDMVRAGTLAGPSQSQNVYLCKFGALHVCSADACTVYGESPTHTCHISGRQFAGAVTSTYSRGDYRTWRAKDHLQQPQPTEKKKKKRKKKRKEAAPPPAPAPPLKKPRAPPKPLADAVVLDRAGDTVTLLLYSQCRRARNKAFVRELQREADKAKVTYVMQRARMGQLPYKSDLYRIVGDVFAKPLPFVEYELDAHLVTYYAHVVLQVWRLVCEHFPKEERVEFAPVCLGTLYAMRHGHMCEGAYVLPKDAFLLIALPLINELPFFGKTVEKKHITWGMKIVASTYQCAVAKGLPVRELALRLDKLPVKKTD